MNTRFWTAALVGILLSSCGGETAPSEAEDTGFIFPDTAGTDTPAGDGANPGDNQAPLVQITSLPSDDAHRSVND